MSVTVSTMCQAVPKCEQSDSIAWGIWKCSVPSRHRESKRLLFWFVLQMFSSDTCTLLQFPWAVFSGAIIAVSRGLDRSLREGSSIHAVSVSSSAASAHGGEAEQVSEAVPW